MTHKTPFNVWNAVQIGLIGGVVSLLLSLVGMVEAFDERDIIVNVITMGQTLLLVVFLMIGYVVARRAAASYSPAMALPLGTLAGGVSAALLGLLVLVGRAADLREVLVNASPGLYQILTLHQESTLGFVYLLLAGVAAGLIGGVIYFLPSHVRRAVASALAWVALLGLLQNLIQVTLSSTPDLARLFSWMFGTGTETGLSTTGAVAVSLVVVTANLSLARYQSPLRSRINALPPTSRRATRWVSLALLAAFLFYLPNLMGPILSEVANTVGIYILAGLGLNIVVGFAGLLDLGYVAFYAIGAYVMGVLTTTGGELSTSLGLTFWEALPLAVGTAVLFGVLLGVPVLNIRGDYLAIVTLGFGEIIRILALSDFLKPHIGGSQGIVQVGRGEIGNLVFSTPQTLYYLVLAACLLAAFVAIRLKDSRMGRTWMALREDEDVAQAMGIHLVKTKLLAFGTGAAFSGLAGAIFASKIGSIYPHSFQLLFSINVLALIIVGGMGSIPGVVVGALALAGLPELLREFAEFRLLVYGAVLVAMMLLRPEGLMPEEARRRELHVEEEAAVAAD
ncbi:MAG: leucine/isoleucine/valine transporter permease subunit [Chloroflexota bacterium]